MSYYRQGTIGIITLLWISISVGLLVYAISQKPADLQLCVPIAVLEINCSQPARQYYQLQDQLTAAVSCDSFCQCPNITLDNRYWCARWRTPALGLQLLVEGPKEERVTFYALGTLLLLTILACIVLPEAIERWAEQSDAAQATLLVDQHLTLTSVQHYGGPHW